MNDTLDSGGAGRVSVERLVVDPRATQQLGEELLAQLGDREFDEIFIWDEPESAVLAHAIGLARGVRVRRALEIEGLVEAIDDPITGARALVLAPVFVKEGSWRAMASLTERAQGTIVAVAAIQASEPLDGARAAGYDVVVLQQGSADGAAEAGVGPLPGTSA